MRKLPLMVALLLALPALAWNYEDLWNYSAVAPRPGGGRNWSTGGKVDKGILCEHCHIATPGAPWKAINLQFTFSPVLQTGASGKAYKPGQVYAVTASLIGEHLGQTAQGNVNSFTATFENAAGQTAGRLASDSGQSSTNCPANILGPASNNLPAGSTTVMAGPCHAVAGRGRVVRGLTTWKFTWTAPSAGAGPLTLFWGVVDGDGKESSLNDDVRQGTLILPEGT